MQIALKIAGKKVIVPWEIRFVNKALDIWDQLTTSIFFCAKFQTASTITEIAGWRTRSPFKGRFKKRASELLKCSRRARRSTA